MKSQLAASFGGVADRERKHPVKRHPGYEVSGHPGYEVSGPPGGGLTGCS